MPESYQADRVDGIVRVRRPEGATLAARVRVTTAISWTSKILE